VTVVDEIPIEVCVIVNGVPIVSLPATVSRERLAAEPEATETHVREQIMDMGDELAVGLHADIHGELQKAQIHRALHLEVGGE